VTQGAGVAVEWPRLPQTVELPGLPGGMDVYGKLAQGGRFAPPGDFPTHDHTPLENGKARFPQPLGKPVRNDAQDRRSPRTGFPQFHSLDEDEGKYHFGA